MERTLVILKPDAFKRKFLGKIIDRIEKNGFKIVASKMIKINQKMAEKHYPNSESQIVGMGNKTLNGSPRSEVRRIFRTEDPWKIGLVLRKWLLEYITSGPVIALIVEGNNAIKRMRDIAGFTVPVQAKKGTIRGDFGIDSVVKANREKRAVVNLIHVSGSREEARKEIRLWFKKSEIYA